MDQQIKKIIISKEFRSRFWVALLLITGIISSSPYKFIFIVLSGIWSSLFYGCYNDIIWRPNNIDKLSDLPYYRAHQMWIHIICGLAGGICLFILLTLFTQNNVGDLFGKYSFSFFVLAFITVMSYIGLLPRLLWYTSYGLEKLWDLANKKK